MDNPIVEYWPNGNKKHEEWFDREIVQQVVNRDAHRIGSPAVIWWHENGQIEQERYILNGMLYRIGGPAITCWYNDGGKYYEAYYTESKIHRLDGPAITTHMVNKNKEETWWVNNQKYTKEEHPFTIFCEEHNLSNNYEQWSADMKILFKLVWI